MDAKTIAWLSYITLIGWIIAFVTHSNALIKAPLSTFHLRQSFGLMVVYFAAWIISFMLLFSLPLVGTLMMIVYIGLFILWIIGLINAVNGEMKPLPVVGPLFQQWFAFIK